MSYLALIVLTLIIGVGAQAWVNHALKKYSRVPIASNKTGAQAAREMLNFYGIDIPINMGAEGQDFFDPRTNSITLSPSAYGQASITALATACHECGHACQYAQKYVPMSIRSALVPAVNLCSNVWVVVLFLGIALNVAGLTWAAIGLYAVCKQSAYQSKKFAVRKACCALAHLHMWRPCWLRFCSLYICWVCAETKREK